MRLVSWTCIVTAMMAVAGPVEVAKNAGKSLSIRVVDSESEEPVTKFVYQYRIRVPGIYDDYAWSDWKNHSSPDGVLTLNGTAPCEIQICIEAREYKTGFWHTQHSVGFGRDDADRAAVIKLKRGDTVTGRVIDAETQQPIRGAEVAPDEFTPPSHQPAWHRKVFTDEAGNFTLPGIDSTVTVRHHDYLQSSFSLWSDVFKEKESVAGKVVRLKRGETLVGLVTLPDGMPLAGVEVTDEHDKFARTNNEGRFRLVSPCKWNSGAYSLKFRKKDFIDVKISPTQAEPNGLSVKMEPAYEFRGRVLSPDGKPIPKFAIIIGPGHSPMGFQCSQRNIAENDATFVVTSDKAGEHWVSVRADGFAVWEGWFHLKREPGTPAEIVLSSGASVSGKITRPGNSGGAAEIILTPCRPEPESVIVPGPSPACEFGRRRTVVGSDGSFVIKNVRPDRFLLQVEGKQFSPRCKEIVVPAAGIEMPSIRLAGTGRLKGQIYKPEVDGGGPWAFADCGISWAGDRRIPPKYLHVKADENGCFDLSDVPVGLVEVSVTTRATADIYNTTTEVAFLFANQTAEVKMFQPKKAKAP